jgi:hypothetical protein
VKKYLTFYEKQRDINNQHNMEEALRALQGISCELPQTRLYIVHLELVGALRGGAAAAQIVRRVRKHLACESR